MNVCCFSTILKCCCLHSASALHFSLQPFDSETELTGRLLYLVLSFTVQHVGGGDALDGQDHITGGQVHFGGLTAWSDLKASREEI